MTTIRIGDTITFRSAEGTKMGKVIDILPTIVGKKYVVTTTISASMCVRDEDVIDATHGDSVDRREENSPMRRESDSNVNVTINVPEGLRGIDINFFSSFLDANQGEIARMFADYKDEQTEKIDDAGYIEELESRWIPVQLWDLVYGGSNHMTYTDNLNRIHSYLYPFEFFIGKGGNKGEIHRMMNDPVRMKQNKKFFSKDLFIAICEDALMVAKDMVDRRKFRGRYQGKLYKRFGTKRKHLDVIIDVEKGIDQSAELIYAPLAREIEFIRRCNASDYLEMKKHLKKFYTIFRFECYLKPTNRYKICKLFEDAFKGNGAYHAIRDLIRDPKKKLTITLHKVSRYDVGALDDADKIFGDRTSGDIHLNTYESLSYLDEKKNNIELGSFYKLLGVYKQIVDDNDFDMKEHLKDYRHVANAN